MANQRRSKHGARRGEGAIDHLLVLTLAFVGVIVAAYVWMPDTRRAFGTVVSDFLDHVGFEVE